MLHTWCCKALVSLNLDITRMREFPHLCPHPIYHVHVHGDLRKTGSEYWGMIHASTYLHRFPSRCRHRSRARHFSYLPIQGKVAQIARNMQRGEPASLAQVGSSQWDAPVIQRQPCLDHTRCAHKRIYVDNGSHVAPVGSH